jgi:hypothetical protein
VAIVPRERDVPYQSSVFVVKRLVSDGFSHLVFSTPSVLS